MASYEDVLNGVVDDDIENLFGDSSKSMAKMVEQGAKSAIKETQVIAYDDTTTAGTTYLQYADGAIRKWTSSVRYVANSGTLWADRATATYTAETV